MRIFGIAIIVVLLSSEILSCSGRNSTINDNTTKEKKAESISKVDTLIYPGIYQTDKYFNLLTGKKIAVVSNHTGIINSVHLVDTLLSREFNLVKVFCPEHGFRGTVDAGAKISDEVDEKTGLPIVSLYGKNKKPTPEQLNNVDIVVFDLQDVGARFYTYISTLHYVMEACAEQDIPVIVLDRPNPNAYYIDGPVLDTSKYRSFIGMHPVPIVYGMTIGEYAKMINGEKWLKGGINCKLTVIPCKNYNHNKHYSLPVKPSPNLPNDRSIELYPTLCIFEATVLSVGRGTDKQFQIFGHPLYKDVEGADFTFTPKPTEGAKDPVLNGKLCYGFDLSKNNSIFDIKKGQINLDVIIKAYNLFPDNDNFFKKTNSLELLAGNSEFRKQITSGLSEKEIRETWKQDIENFKQIRKKYLIYE